MAIDHQAQRLNRLVSNLLDLSRIEGGALRVAHDGLDVEDVVSRGVAAVERRAGTRRLETDIPAGVAVVADPVLLEEALGNLLDNAIRHTPDGALVRISATAATPADEVLRITVEDSGPGVPDEALGRIFDKFYRSSARHTGSAVSTGIGLAVVRGFVEAMGGHVAARRGDLDGLAIDVDMPVARLPAALQATD